MSKTTNFAYLTAVQQGMLLDRESPCENKSFQNEVYDEQDAPSDGARDSQMNAEIAERESVFPLNDGGCLRL